MKWITITAALLFLLLAGPLASLAGEIDDHPNCVKCGMNRKAYGYSRVVVSHSDSSTGGYCSIACALQEIDGGKGVKGVLVADRASRELVEAQKAFWVIGGSKPGVMTRRAKWAFASREGAEKFLKTYGGRIATYEEILSASREDAAEAEKEAKSFFDK